MKQKGWVIKDAMRGDHVADAFIMALFTILSGQVLIPDRKFEADDGYADARKAFEFKLRNDENRELSGFTGNKSTSDETFQNVFGRKKSPSSGGPATSGNQFHYKDY
jgi:hypothetical protein